MSRYMLPCPRCGKVRQTKRADAGICRACWEAARSIPHTFDHIDHGTPKGYGQHRDWGIPRTADCGCLEAAVQRKRQQRHARGERKSRCTVCIRYRMCRDDRDGMCAPCWKAANPETPRDVLESPAELDPCRWVMDPRRLVLVYQEDRPA